MSTSPQGLRQRGSNASQSEPSSVVPATYIQWQLNTVDLSSAGPSHSRASTMNTMTVDLATDARAPLPSDLNDRHHRIHLNDAQLLKGSAKAPPKTTSRISTSFASVIWSFATIIVTDGVQTGVKVCNPAEDDDQLEQDNIQVQEMAKVRTDDLTFIHDAIRERKLPIPRFTCVRSVWEIMSTSKPTGEMLKEMIATCNGHFRKIHGFDMIFERGTVGETVLHYAMLRRQWSVLEFLLEEFESIGVMVNLVYEGPEYWGEHAAHIAVVNYGNDTKMLEKLIACGADVHNARASGSFFDIDKDGSIYMGGTVLSFAACMGYSKIVDYLINVIGVDPNLLDFNGNNVLHVLAWWGFYDDQRQTYEVEFCGDAAFEVEGDDVEDLATRHVRVVDPEKKPFSPAVAAALSPVGSTQPVPGAPPSQASGGGGGGSDDDTPEVSGLYSVLSVKNDIKSQKELDKLDPDDARRYNHELRVTADDTLANNEDLTPLLVAVQKGNAKMVRALLDYKAEPQWTYGPVRQFRYCLSEIDNFVEKETMNHKTGALEMAVKNQYIEIVTQPIFKKLLEAKWKLYGRNVFMSRFVVNLIYILLLSVAIGILPNGQDYYQTDSTVRPPIPYATSRLNYLNSGTTGYVRLVLELMITFANVWSIGREFIEINNSAKNYFLGFGGFENGVQWLNIILFVVVVVMRFVGLYDYENLFLGINAITAWLSILYYTKGHEALGPLAIIFYEVMTTTLVRFLILLAVFVISFSEALWLQMAPYADSFVNSNAPNASAYGTFKDWQSLHTSIVWGIRFVYGQGSYDDLRNANHAIALILFLVSVLVITVLTLNLFIAMLNDVFNRIQGDAKNKWTLSWAQLIMEMDEKILAGYQRSLRANNNRKHRKRNFPPPITRIGVPRIAQQIKPYKRLAEDASKVADLQGGGNVNAEQQKALSKWAGYIYDFILEFKAGSDEPIRMVATEDKHSVLYEDPSENVKHKVVKNRRD